MAPAPRKQKSVAYLLWCLGFFGLCGVHRLYTERYLLGILYLFTFGFCFLGQLVDLLLIPDDVGSFNVSERQRAVARLTPSRTGPAVVTRSGSELRTLPGASSGSGPAASAPAASPPATASSTAAQPPRSVSSSDALPERTRSLMADARAAIERLDQQG
jgi:TM2 domain-containing membrane protein YozV